MENQTVCSTCRTPIPRDAPLGQCPKCLVETVLLPNTPPSQALPREFGDYTLLKLIGSSGMGNVYEALQIKLKRRVAVKLIKNPDDAELVQRFYTEAEAAARLQHSNIVAIHDFGMWEGQPFLCMDLVDGESLKECLKQGRFKPAEHERKTEYRARQGAEICRLVIKIARALAYAHENNVIHRDIKPDNIVLDRRGEPHLIDFGLAKITEPHRIKGTITGQIMGSLPWMAPEQASGGETTTLTDVHGLGAILYHLLTARAPFHGRTPKETLDQVMEQPPRRVTAVNPLADEELSVICEKCLEKDPLHRFSSMEELTEQLELWLANKPITVKRPTRARRVKQWIQRNKLATALIASLCLALVLALSVVVLATQAKNRAIEKQNALFDGSQKRINDFWKSDNPSLTITYQEMAGLLPGRHTAGQSVDHDLTIGFWIENNPFNVAMGLADFLGKLEASASHETGKALEFNLKFYKWHVSQAEELAEGKADLALVDPLAYVDAKAINPNIVPLAFSPANDHLVVFNHRRTEIRQLEDFKGRSIILPDPQFSFNALMKALFVDSGIARKDLRGFAELHNSATGITNLVLVPARNNTPAKTNVTVLGIHDMELVMEKVRTEEYTGGAIAMRKGRLMGNSTAGVQLDRRLMNEIASFPTLPMVFIAREGLAPRLRQAAQQALTQAGMVPIEDDSYFNGLREAKRKAALFDGPPSSKP